MTQACDKWRVRQLIKEAVIERLMYATSLDSYWCRRGAVTYHVVSPCLCIVNSSLAKRLVSGKKQKIISRPSDYTKELLWQIVCVISALTRNMLQSDKQCILEACMFLYAHNIIDSGFRGIDTRMAVKQEHGYIFDGWEPSDDTACQPALATLLHSSASVYLKQNHILWSFPRALFDWWTSQLNMLLRLI